MGGVGSEKEGGGEIEGREEREGEERGGRKYE